MLLTRCHVDAVLTRQPSAFAAQSPGEVKEGAAYAQETRRTILTMNKLTKSTPTGKQLLKNVSLGIYLGCAPPALRCPRATAYPLLTPGPRLVSWARTVRANRR